MRLRVRIAILAVCVSVAFASATFAQEPPPKIQAGGGVMFHVAADLMRVRHHENYSPWTWRVTAGLMLPGR